MDHPIVKKGKNFSGNNVDGKRRESDFYETPFSLTWQLLEVEDFSDCSTVLEPCCGDEAIVSQLDASGKFKTIHYYDLSEGTDFLEESKTWDCIITNPPFSKALEFIEKSKLVAIRKFAMLLPLSYLHGEQRYRKVYQDIEYPLRKVHVFTRYPLLGEPLREDGKYHTGMMVYAWFVWIRDPLLRGFKPEISWISNQKYILNKKDK